ncbi:ISL3 family transposase [Microvirga sp. VF16]|uniref:ISL3 family transposase n=1 Tax=Microvirga sp. VF16 TaxID=2807101 RepID=UPI00193E86ED|nr:ISL3 family transposase [Microvirga sp. VF16]QRM31350.1 ISL3 family transposase [Microvirga sp. VF16]QRM34407.1 ISL3 family transposase [Microvirga sp. VF16]
MGQHLRVSELVPGGFIVDEVAEADFGIRIGLRASSAESCCPGCGTTSTRVHSRYTRQLADLPLSGRPVRLVVRARRFHCEAVLCPRRIFTERFDNGVLLPWSRRTSRLDQIIHHLGLALGGRPAARFAQRLMLPASNDTLLRVIRRRGRPPFIPPTVIGIDDWAWRRNQRYGTLICDLERRQTIALLPDREPATTQAWLTAQPQINIVARDRGGGYALAAAKALPAAMQVADRWHLMENASQAFIDAVRKSMRQLRAVVGAATIAPDLLTAAERIQYEGYLRREETNAAILELAKAEVTIKEIVRRTGYSRGLVRRVLRGQRSDVFRSRESSLELFLPWLDAQWAAGQRNGAELWRRLGHQGFRGSLRVVTEWATRRRRAETIEDGILKRTPSARTLARLMTIARDKLSRSETVLVAAIESGVPSLVEAREIIAAFQGMIRRKALADLAPWLERANSSLVAAFGRGVRKDHAAVAAAITSSWSNGQTEGQITKLKLVKRQMYGRGKLDLLEARLVAPA